MAIARGPGTEIIRSAHFETINTTQQMLIVGVQHHIYTVLSIIIFSENAASDTDYIKVAILGYDAVGGTTNQTIQILHQIMPDEDTFVWNDKFSFNGYEPANFTGPLSTAAHQDAIADQGGSAVQRLACWASHADLFDLNITYIDQNNA